MAEQTDNDIDKLVAHRLREAGLKFATEKAIGLRHAADAAPVLQ